MRKFLLAMTGAGALAVCGFAVTPAQAGPTQDQANAEWLEQPAGGAVAVTPSGAVISGQGPSDPMMAANGAAQRRSLSVEQQQLLPH